MISTAPADYLLDLEATFDRHWVAVARAAELKGKGAYQTRSIGTEPIVVLRNGKGEVRAHLNVCRHRGSQILEGAGRVKGLMCPYHGWMYSLDGELRGAPEMKYTERFDKSEFPLVSFEALEWAGFVMLSMKPAAPDPVGAELNRDVVAELSSARTAGSWTSDVEGDWRDVLASVAGAMASTWVSSPTRAVLHAEKLEADIDLCMLLRPGLLLVRHDDAWASLSVVPGQPGRTLLTGNCLVPQAEVQKSGHGDLPDAGSDGTAGDLAEADGALMARSKKLLQPSNRGAVPSADQVLGLLREWTDEDRSIRLGS